TVKLLDALCGVPFTAAGTTPVSVSVAIVCDGAVALDEFDPLHAVAASTHAPRIHAREMLIVICPRCLSSNSAATCTVRRDDGFPANVYFHRTGQWTAGAPGGGQMFSNLFARARQLVTQWQHPSHITRGDVRLAYAAAVTIDVAQFLIGPFGWSGFDEVLDAIG